jgi:hypothetical protein
MSAVVAEISELEERLRLAELAPDPAFFEAVLDDDAVMVSDEGEASLAKSRVVNAHQPGNGPKFTAVTMTQMQIVEHGTAAVVTCQGRFEGPDMSVTLKFMRVWIKKGTRWQIVAVSISK